MRSKDDLSKHIQATCSCAKRFILTKKYQSDDLFNSSKTTSIAPLPLFCKSYFCESCSAKKNGKHRHRVEDNLRQDSWRFITLTTLNTYNNSVEQLLKINFDWNKMRTLLKKKYGKFSYVKVPEIGKDGMVHLHILVNCYMPKLFLKRVWHKYTGAYIVDISRVKSHKDISHYITKYMTKLSAYEKSNELFYLTRRRRITFSQDMKAVPFDDIIYKLIDGSIFKEKELIKKMISLIVDYNIIYDDFDFNNLPPPLDEFFKNDFKEIYKVYSNRDNLSNNEKNENYNLHIS